MGCWLALKGRRLSGRAPRRTPPREGQLAVAWSLCWFLLVGLPDAKRPRKGLRGTYDLYAGGIGAESGREVAHRLGMSTRSSLRERNVQWRHRRTVTDTNPQRGS